MNLATLDITQEQAEAALAEYNKLVADDRTEEDRAIAQAYRAAARGLSIIRLTEAFKIAGHFPGRGHTNGVPNPGLPRLAICRADAKNCHVRCDGDDFVFSGDQWLDNRGALVGKNTVRVPGANPGRTWDRARTDGAADPASVPTTASPDARLSRSVGSRVVDAGAAP